jgi:hypothetical protein
LASSRPVPTTYFSSRFIIAGAKPEMMIRMKNTMQMGILEK